MILAVWCTSVLVSENVPEQLICNGMGQVLFCFMISFMLYGKYNLVFDKATQHDQHVELGVVLFPTYLFLSHLLKIFFTK